MEEFKKYLAKVIKKCLQDIQLYLLAELLHSLADIRLKNPRTSTRGKHQKICI